MFFPTTGSCKLMKMHLHTHALRHTWRLFFFFPLCALFLFSLFVSMVTVKLTCTVWGEYHNLNQALLLHTAAEHCSFRGSDDRFQQNSSSWLEFRKPVKIPSTKVSCMALYWAEFLKMQCSNVVLFFLFYKPYVYKFFCLR